MAWSVAAPAVSAAFLASLVEVVEAFTIVLAVATLRGWRPAALGTIAGLGTLAGIVVVLGPLLDRVPVRSLQLAIGVLLLLFGMGWLRKASLRAAGVIEGGAAGVKYLRQAIAELERSPARLEHVRALAALGAALRRNGKRAEAQRTLREALDLADRCDAKPVAEQAREELVISGARPRPSHHCFRCCCGGARRSSSVRPPISRPPRR